jgi:hypothetical protein
MTLEYLREYRTYFHIGQSWGVNESTAYRIIRRIEDTLDFLQKSLKLTQFLADEAHSCTIQL